MMMIRISKLIAATVLASSFVISANAEGRSESQIRQVDAEFRKAMVTGDAEKLAMIVADDAKIIHGYRGGIQDKRGLITEFRSYHIDKYDRSPVFSEVNGNSAVLVSVTHKLIGGQQIVTTTTEVLVRRAGRWQILVLQNTDHAAS